MGQGRRRRASRVMAENQEQFARLISQKVRQIVTGPAKRKRRRRRRRAQGLERRGKLREMTMIADRRKPFCDRHSGRTHHPVRDAGPRPDRPADRRSDPRRGLCGVRPAPTAAAPHTDLGSGHRVRVPPRRWLAPSCGLSRRTFVLWDGYWLRDQSGQVVCCSVFAVVYRVGVHSVSDTNRGGYQFVRSVHHDHPHWLRRALRR